MITVSVVSHGHGGLVERLLRQLRECPEISHIILTQNVPEALSLPDCDSLQVIVNSSPKGFGANHNAAFSRVKTPLFCVLNPDIELPKNPFSSLVSIMAGTAAGLGAPAIVDSDGIVQDSMRHFPTPWRLFHKLLSGEPGVYVGSGGRVRFPDWVAGMFMLFQSSEFSSIGGFDEGYYLYYEDVDICARIWRAGGCIVGDDGTVAVHNAQRESRRRLRFAVWHAKSMTRFFYKHFLRLPR